MMRRKNKQGKADIDKSNGCNSCVANVGKVGKFRGIESGAMESFSQVDGIPILRAEFFALGRVRVWCEQCSEFHCHGWPPGTPDDSLEHRVAHCHTRPKGYPRGYYLKLSGGEA
jgi:hypothetical protein